MKHKLLTSPVATFSIPAALLVVVGLGAAPARADMTESVFGALGLMPNEELTKPPERAPLVIPPTQKLPKPKKLAQPGDANWVKDADLTKKKAEEDAPFVPGQAFASFITQTFPEPSASKHALVDPPSEIQKKAVITPEIEAATKAATGETDKPWYKFW